MTAPHRKLTQAELAELARKRFGDDPKLWAFRCPQCKDVATVQDFIDAGVANAAGQHCIGRNLGALEKDVKPYTGRGCNWAAYGLFRGPWEVVLPAEGGKPERSAWSFELADAPVGSGRSVRQRRQGRCVVTAPENTSRRPPELHLLGAMTEGTSGYILGMEAAGQRQLVASQVLPARMHPGREAYEALGFVFGDPVDGDPLFVHAALPPGWTKRPDQGHDMWAYIDDDAGVERVQVFYKAAFYDRRAHMSLTPEPEVFGTDDKDGA